MACLVGAQLTMADQGDQFNRPPPTVWYSTCTLLSTYVHYWIGLDENEGLFRDDGQIAWEMFSKCAKPRKVRANSFTLSFYIYEEIFAHIFV
jgi:hypothetical protein